MNIITIKVSILNKRIWALIRSLAEDIYNKKINHECLKILLSESASVIFNIEQDNVLELTSQYNHIYIETLLKNYNFEPIVKIIYIKNEASRDFSELIPLLYMPKETKVFLYIDISNVEEKECRDRYYFSCSQFFYYIEDDKVKNKIFIIDKSDKSNSEFLNRKVYAKKLASNLDYNLTTVFSPLIEITEDSKQTLFDNISSHSLIHVLLKYTRAQADKRINKRLNKVLNDIKYKNQFSEIFIKNLLINLDEKSLDLILNKDIENSLFLLNSYCYNIKELVENILFHTNNKKGYLYFAFNKLSDISEVKRKIFEKNQVDILRLVEICIYDFNKKGILDTFKCSDKISLIDFFNLDSIISTGLTHLDFRYMAHLGLKSFAKSVVKNKGVFYIETNSLRENNKHTIRYYWDKANNSSIDESKIIDNYYVDGTHYEIIFPFSPSLIATPKKNLISYQSKSFIEIYQKWILHPKNSRIQTISINNLLNSYEPKNIGNKEEQINFITEIGDKIINSHINNQIISIDYKRLPTQIDNILLYKLLAYIQLKNNEFFEIMVIHNVNRNLLESIKDIIQIFSQNKCQLWNDETALVLITEDLNCYIVSGRTEEQINKYNKIIQQYYPLGKERIEYNFPSNNKTEDIIINSNYVLPYDLLVSDDNSIFENYVSHILDNYIEDYHIGYKLNNDYVKLGGKIITKYFYEADTIFQNSFFVDRFAYLISKNLLQSIGKFDKKIVLIGYGQYSELLLNTIKNIINTGENNKIFAYIIAKDYQNDIEWIFESNSKTEIFNKANEFLFSIIVPIGSTTTTNDKIIAKFRQYVYMNTVFQLSDLQFVYNCSAIIVRDNDKYVDPLTNITKNESRIGWESINNKTVKTKFGNPNNNVHYIISKNGEWLLPINEDISFPQNYWDEKSVHLTKVSSLNTKRLISFPKVKRITKETFKESCNRLLDLKDFISIGHIEKESSHDRYYIDTEGFVKNECNSFINWLKTIKDKIKFTEKIILNLLVTPSANMESDLIKRINEIVFNNSGLIIYIDIDEEYRNNIIHKYSFLRGVSNDIHIHFIDHVLLTGESVKKARSYISSIFGENVQFYSIITIINRLSYNRDREINEYKSIENEIINSYITLFIPPSQEPGKECGICSLIKHYENDIINQTSLDSCYITAQRKIQKIQKTKFVKDDYKKISERKFKQILLTHQLFYEISEMVHNLAIKDEIVSKLDEIFNSKENDKITFLKVLSAHPMNHYMHIREYVQTTMLNELKNILLKKSQPKICDYNYLLVLMKHLSELGSSALIRNKVIIDIWEFYFCLKQRGEFQKEINQIQEQITILENQIAKTKEDKYIIITRLKNEDKEELSLFRFNEEELNDIENKLQNLNDNRLVLNKKIATIEYNESNFKELFALYIKNTINDDESKAFWLGELLRQGCENINFENPITSKNIENNSLFTHFNGYSMNLKESYINTLREVYRIKSEDIIDSIEYDLKDLKTLFYDKGKLKGYKEIMIDEIYQATYKIIEKYLKSELGNNSIEFVKKLYSKLDELNIYYKDFLMQIFYDNTTIIRKTLDKFNNELNKNKELNSLFYNDEKLIEYKNLQKNHIENIFSNIIKLEYYYRNAKEYIESKNNNGLLGILIDLLYIRLLVSDINHKKDKSNEIIQKQYLEPLLEVLANIMGADTARLVIADSGTNFSKDASFYDIACFKKELPTEDKQSVRIINETSYVYRTLRKGHWTYPFIVQSDVSKFDEGILGYKSLNMLIIYEPLHKMKQSATKKNTFCPIGCISFMYKSTIDKINSQEKGRLILIVRSLINEYIDSLLNRSIVNDWIEKALNKKKFDEIYLNSSHYENEYVYPAIKEIESLIYSIENDTNLVKYLYKTYYVLSNIIITGIYSRIERKENVCKQKYKEERILTIFNKYFLLILQLMAEQMFNEGGVLKIINEVKNNDVTRYEKYVLQSFVIQCIHNSMRKHLRTFDKTTTLIIRDNEVIIKNDFSKRKGYAEEITERINKFKLNKTSIENLRCEEYSCTTLTSIQGYSQELGNSCMFQFDEDLFTVIIKLN